MRRQLQALVAAILIAAFAPTAAQATGDTYIGFDDITQDGVSVTNQYASLGVTFGSTSSFGVNLPGNGCGAPVTGSDPQDYDGGGRWIQPPRCGAAEFEYSGSTLSFSWPHQSVSVWALAVPGYSPTIRMTGYDTELNQIATTSQTLSDTYWTHVTLSAGNPAMSWLVIDTDQAGPVAEFVLDSLQYDANAAPLSVAAGLSATAGTAFSGTLGHITDADTTAVASDFTAQIAWGDGSISAGSVTTATGGGFDIVGTHAYAAAGSLPLSVSVNKINGRTASGSGNANVVPPGSPLPPANTALPVISGTTTAGQLLSSTSGGWTGNPTFAYQWRDCDTAGNNCSNVTAGGTASTYTLTATDVGKTLRVLVTATNAGGSVSATSDKTAAVTLPPLPLNVTRPFIYKSRFRDGFVCDPGTWQNLPANPTFGYEWLRRSFLTTSVVATTQAYSPSVSPSLFACRVTVRNGAGSTVATSDFSQLVPGALFNGAGTVDIRVTGIEVTQAIQESSCAACAGTLPSRDQANLTTAGSADYQGVTLAAGKFTVVRVFANFTQPADLSSLTGATATLQIYDSDGHQISTLNPDSSPATLSQPDCGACVSPSERANPGASFNFLVPWQETLHRTLSFRATVIPRVGLTQPTQCNGCKANTFTLLGVPFVSTATVPIHPIPLTVGGVRSNKTENQVFGDAQTVLPNQVQIFPYDTTLAVDNMNNAQAVAAVLQRASDDHLTSSDYPIGVFFKGEGGKGGLANGLTLGGHKLYDQNGPISIVQDDRPLTSVAHEIGHGLGLVHASNECGGGQDNDDDDNLKDSSGNNILGPDGKPQSNGQVGEPWPPDEQGRIQSIGLDRRNWDIFQTGSLPQTFVEGYDHLGGAAPGTQYYDFMSYCPPGGVIESLDWISLRNWNQLIAFHPPVQALTAAAASGGRAASGVPVRVIATVDSADSTSIVDVATGQATATGSTPGSPYRIELRDGTGAVLASVTPNTTPIHVDGEPGQRPPLVLQATLPLVPSTAAVVVTAGGHELARRDRSKQAPSAAILTPRRGSHVGGAATTLVLWAAHDADGDALSATVDYSPDGGRHWKVVADDVRGNSVRLPSRALSASRNGRLRVRVSDGFDVATATSGPLMAAGAPPSVRIIGSGGGGRVRADAALLVQGEAFDDSGRPLTGPHLTWYAGRRLLGHGELLTALDLPLGTTEIRLLATDSHGRTSRATLPLKVVPVPPTFLLARAPTRVSANARSVRIVVASNAPAVLTIAGARHRVDRKPRTIKIKIRPGRSPLRLKYTLRSSGGVTQQTYVAAR
jgi:hypothetical protein